MKITFTDILIEAYDRRWGILSILAISFVVWAAMRGCSEQKLLDESNAVCRAVIVSKSATTKGKITKFEFMVDGVEYKGAGGGVTTSVGDSLNVKYAMKDPSINTLLYSSEYSDYTPKPNAVRNGILISLSILIILTLLTYIVIIKSSKKNKKETD